MNIGILTIHDRTFHPNARLDQAARALGHELVLINPHQTVCFLEKQRPDMAGSGLKHPVSGSLPDVVLPRQGSPMGEYGFVLLRQFQALGVPLVNDLKGVTIARNQYITLQALAGAGIPIPDTCFVTRPGAFFDAVARLGGYPVVAKQPCGMGGDGVVKIDTADQARACLESLLDPEKGLVVQQFFSPAGRVDVRILVIGGHVAGAVKLLPAGDDFRTNIHQNSRATALDPPAAWVDMAVAAATACCLEIAGIDMVVKNQATPRVLEVNYSPGFRGLEAATGIDIAVKIIGYAVGAAGLKSAPDQRPSRPGKKRR